MSADNISIDNDNRNKRCMVEFVGRTKLGTEMLFMRCYKNMVCSDMKQVTSIRVKYLMDFMH